MKIFGREPALWVAFIVAALMAVATIGFDWLNAGQAAMAGGFVVAVVAVFTTRPVAPGIFTGVVTAAVGLLAAYGTSLPDSQVVGLNAVVLTLFALITRNQVSPKQTPVNNC